MGLAAAQRTDCCWLLLFLLLQYPGLGCVGANHRKSGRNKKTRGDSYPGPRWRGPSCQDGLSPSRTFPPLAVPSPAVSLLALLSPSAMLAGPLLSRAGRARSMPPNPVQNVPQIAHRVPPGPHSRDLNSCPREREGGYKPIPPDLPGGYRSPERLLLQLQRLSSAAGFPLTPKGRWLCVCMCGCVCVFIKLHITAQSGPVILVILCHSH